MDVMELSNTIKILNEFKEQLVSAHDFDVSEMYELLMDYGDKLGNVDVKDFDIVPGCTSRIFMKVIEEGNRIFIKGTADSKIIKGQIYILISSLSGLNKDELKKTRNIINDFVEQTKIAKSSVRTNTFMTIYNYIMDNI